MFIEMKESVSGLWQDAANFVGEQKNKIAATVTLGFGSAHAAIPANVQTALDTGLTDASAVAALGLIIVVAIAVFKYMRRGV